MQWSAELGAPSYATTCKLASLKYFLKKSCKAKVEYVLQLFRSYYYSSILKHAVTQV